MTSPTLWVYWEGPCSDFYQLCWQTIARHNPTARRIGPEDVVDLGGRAVLNACQGLPHAIRSDLIRAWLLQQHGGVWIDADSIAMQPLDWSDVDSRDLIVVRNPNKHGIGARGCVATPWGCRAGSPLAIEIYGRVLHDVQTMQSGKHVPYGQTSTGVLSQVLRANRDAIGRSIVLHAHWRYCPVPWHLARRVYLRPGSSVFQYLKPIIRLYHLTNPIPKAFAGQHKHDILAGQQFVCRLLRRALNNGPVPARTKSILQRLPADRDLVGVEVGVYAGVNACALLRHRPRLRLLLVDPYADLQDPTYQATRDFQARLNNQRWAAIFAQTQSRLAWAGERAEFVRQPSLTAATQIRDASLDFVFIDGNHAWQAAAADVAAWWPKVRAGGWIGGHDYLHPKAKQRGYGVTAAVDTWAAKHGLRIERGLDTTWFVTVN